MGESARRLWMGAIIGMIAASGIATGARAQVDASGTIHAQEFSYPLSDFLSDAAKKAQTDFIKLIASLPRPPAAGADMSAWDKFNADYNRLLAVILNEEQRTYAANVEETTLGGVHVAVVTPKGGVAAANRRRVLVNLHGGATTGLTKGEIESIPVAALGGFRVIAVDYSQPPYRTFPAAVKDVAALYKELLKQYRPDAVGIFGCSAGGVLATQTASWLQHESLPRPGAVGVFCAAPPDASARRGDSAIWAVTGLLANAAAGPRPGAKTENPDRVAFPGASDSVLAKFPATLLLSGTRAPEMSAVIAAHAHFLKLGVDSSLYIMEGGWHGAAFSGDQTPEARDANAYVAQWFDKHLLR